MLWGGKMERLQLRMMMWTKSLVSYREATRLLLISIGGDDYQIENDWLLKFRQILFLKQILWANLNLLI